MLTCDYCGDTSINYSMYVIRKEIAPPPAPNRWMDYGHCCDDCYDKGELTQIIFEVSK